MSAIQHIEIPIEKIVFLDKNPRSIGEAELELLCNDIRKVKRAKEALNDLETLIDEKQASSRQQQEYLSLKSKIEAWEDAIDLAESIIK